jgi:hypothetical protein
MAISQNFAGTLLARPRPHLEQTDSHVHAWDTVVNPDHIVLGQMPMFWLDGLAMPHCSMKYHCLSHGNHSEDTALDNPVILMSCASTTEPNLLSKTDAFLQEVLGCKDYGVCGCGKPGPQLYHDKPLFHSAALT